MKKAIAIFVFFTLLIQSFAHYSVLAMFELRRDFIAKNLCENRNRPKMKCGGKCYLRKQLKKADSNPTSKSSSNEKEPTELLAFILPQSVILVRFEPKRISVHNPALQHLYDVSEPFLILRPPLPLS